VPHVVATHSEARMGPSDLLELNPPPVRQLSSAPLTSPSLPTPSMPPLPPLPPLPPPHAPRVPSGAEGWGGGAGEALAAEAEVCGVFVSLPAGQHFQLDILSTWGDPYYVGLSALEFFDEHGEPIEGVHTRAEPADINVLPEYTSDVRVAANLTDGVLQTCDDRHLWLAPYSEHRRNLVFVDFGRVVVLSLVRVWNYNKSRTHSFRGARLVEMRVDGVLVFRGEVGKAPGNLHDALNCAEPVLFTTDAHVIARIEAHDAARFEHEPVAELPSSMLQRPPTAELHDSAQKSRQQPWINDVPDSIRNATVRPRTAVLGGGDLGTPGEAVDLSALQDYETAVHPLGSEVRLVLHSTWGDRHYIGLNGLQLLDPTGAPLALSVDRIDADPSSIATLPQMQRDPRTVDKLIDGVNATYDDRHMWLAPFSPGKPNTVTVTFPRPVRIGAIKVWNYAKTPSRGVQSFSIQIDGCLAFQGCMRLAPARVSGTSEPACDFVQTVLFTDNPHLIAAEKDHVYNKSDLEEGLVIFDNGQRLSGSCKQAELARPATSVAGLPPPTAMGRGARR